MLGEIVRRRVVESNDAHAIDHFMLCYTSFKIYSQDIALRSTVFISDGI
jgi:hypothetical protein